MDVDEITTIKVAQNVVMVKDVGEEYGKETLRVNPSVFADPMVKDDDNGDNGAMSRLT